MEYHWNPGLRFYHPIRCQRVFLTFLATAVIGGNGLALVSLLVDVESNDHEERMTRGNGVAGTLVVLWMKHKTIRDQPDGSKTDP